MDFSRPVALVTGVGRTVGIGAAIARRLAGDGFDIATTHWAAYDERMPWGRQDGDVDAVHDQLRTAGARSIAISADLSDPSAPARIFDEATAALGRVTTLVLSHCESVDSTLMDTTVDSFDKHFAVNARASMLLIQEFSRRFGTSDAGSAAASTAEGSPAGGRIVAMTSDHVVGNLPYGASKAALDSIVIGASRELADQRITANVVNPGPIDTGWMSDELADAVRASTPRGRAGTPSDIASVIAFLVSDAGGWVNGQLIHADGGWSVKGG